MINDARMALPSVARRARTEEERGLRGVATVHDAQERQREGLLLVAQRGAAAVCGVRVRLYGSERSPAAPRRVFRAKAAGPAW